MKKLNNYIIWLFLIFSIILFFVPFLTKFISFNPFVNTGTKGDLGEFSRFKKKVIIYNQKDVSNYMFWGDYFEKIDENEKAIYFYKKAIWINPLKTILTYQKLSELYKELGKNKENEDLLLNFANLVIKKQSYYPDLDYNLRKPIAHMVYGLAEDKFNNKEYDESLEIFKMAITIDPWVICHLKPLSFTNVEFSVSKPFIKELINIDNKHFSCFEKYYGKLFYFTGFLEKAANVAPGWTYFWMEWGNTFLVKLEFEKAELIFKSCLKYQPRAEDCQLGIYKAKKKQINLRSYGEFIKNMSDF